MYMYAGTRRYAEGVLKFMDPDGRLFVDRIVSRSDVGDERAGARDKSLQRIFYDNESMAIIMDDNEGVWKGSQVMH